METCYICLTTEGDLTRSPCDCSAIVHLSCLTSALEASNLGITCSICRKRVKGAVVRRELDKETVMDRMECFLQSLPSFVFFLFCGGGTLFTSLFLLGSHFEAIYFVFLFWLVVFTSYSCCTFCRSVQDAERSILERRSKRGKCRVTFRETCNSTSQICERDAASNTTHKGREEEEDGSLPRGGVPSS